jgi:hypothetical protein
MGMWRDFLIPAAGIALAFAVVASLALFLLG